MTQASLRGSKMSFQKEDGETQEKSNEQWIKELGNRIKLLMKDKVAGS